MMTYDNHTVIKGLCRFNLLRKKAEKPQGFISLHCPYDPSHSVVIKIGMVGDRDELIKRANFGNHCCSHEAK
jgi:hypothetical protein